MKCTLSLVALIGYYCSFSAYAQCPIYDPRDADWQNQRGCIAAPTPAADKPASATTQALTEQLEYADMSQATYVDGYRILPVLRNQTERLLEISKPGFGRLLIPAVSIQRLEQKVYNQSQPKTTLPARRKCASSYVETAPVQSSDVNSYRSDDDYYVKQRDPSGGCRSSRDG